MRKVTLQELRSQVDTYPERVELRIQLAQELFREHNQSEALQQSVLAVDLDSTSIEALATKGLCLMVIGEVCAAFEVLLRVAHLDPSCVVLQSTMENMGFELPSVASWDPDTNEFTPSSQICDNLDIDAEQIAKMLAIATAAAAADHGEHVTAIELLRTHLAQFPDDLAAKIMTAGNFQEMGQYEIAIQLYRDVLQIDPDNAIAATDLAVALDCLGQSDEAIRWSRFAVDRCADLTQAKLNLAGFLFNSSHLEEARSIFDDVASFAEGAERATALAGLGLCLQADGDYPQAAQMYRDAIELDPTDPTYCHELAVCCSSSGQMTEAIAVLQNVLAQNPDDADALSQLGHLFKETGDDEASRESYRRAYEADPDDARLIDLANAENKLGNHDAAIQIVASIVEQDPHNALAMQNLGAFYCDLDCLNKAEEFSLRAIEIDDNRVYARWNLATIYARRGDRIRCLHYLKTAMERDPVFAEYARNDPDLAVYRDDDDFKQLIASYPAC